MAKGLNSEKKKFTQKLLVNFTKNYKESASNILSKS